MNLFKSRFYPVCALVALSAVLQSSPASAACRAFPEVEFWEGMSHASVRDYVETKFDGDWSTYIERLERIKKGLENIQKRGKGAIIKRKGRRITLRGGKLGNYIRLSDKRIDVVRCLADNAEMDSLQNFATAAGGDAQDNSYNFPAPVEKSEGYRTYVTLPQTLVVELRKQAKRRSLIENHKVSVNDIIVWSLQQRYAK